MLEICMSGSTRGSSSPLLPTLLSFRPIGRRAAGAVNTNTAGQRTAPQRAFAAQSEQVPLRLLGQFQSERPIVLI
jgi:hypothetical protein